MRAIEVPDPLPPAITLPREVIEFAISQHLESSASTAWSHAPGSGSFTEADQARSVIWIGRSSTATARRRRPP
jgi:hypothetical protein